MTLRLSAILSKLGPDELEVVAELAERLYEGQRCYGLLNLSVDRRDWPGEQRAEIKDLLIYAAFQSLKAKREQKT